MNKKINLNDNENILFHINTDQEIYLLVKDINQKETMVSVSEIYKTLKNIETLLKRQQKYDN